MSTTLTGVISRTTQLVPPSLLKSARLWLIAGLAAASSLTSTNAFAQQDPSGRVGRVSTLEGQVWIRDASGNEQIAGQVNWPVAQGTSLETGLSSRVEVRVGSSTYRFAPDTKAQFTELNDATIRVNVEHGSVALRLKSNDKARETFVNTQTGTLSFNEAGRYRVDADYDRTSFSVQQGQARLDTQNSSFGLRTGGRMEVDNRGNTRNTELFADNFDDWVRNLDRRDDSRPAPRYVSREMTGYDTLEDNGSWNDVDGYGAVWYPRVVVADWAPYRYGHWANVQPWGWTWVDDAPWGFAVSHYGRWGWIGGRWGWVPGAIVSRPVWAPALVAWGGGSGWNWSVSVGAPSYGWVPLAPAEVYVPWYRVSPRYCNNLNVAHVSNVTVINNYYQNPGSQAFMNARVPGAVSAAAAGAAFAGRTFPVGSSLGTTSGSMARAAAAAQQGAVRPAPVQQNIRAVTDIKFAAAAFDQHRIVTPIAAAAAAAGQAHAAPVPIKVTAPAVVSLPAATAPTNVAANSVAANNAAAAAANAARGGAPAQLQPAPAAMPISGQPLRDNNAPSNNPAVNAVQPPQQQAQQQQAVQPQAQPQQRDNRGGAQDAARAAAMQQREVRNGDPRGAQQQQLAPQQAQPRPAQPPQQVQVPVQPVQPVPQAQPRQQAQPLQAMPPEFRGGPREQAQMQQQQQQQAAREAQAAAREARAQQREAPQAAPRGERTDKGPKSERVDKADREDFVTRRLQER